MQILIIFLLLTTTAIAQLSPEQRRINERTSALKDAVAGYCATLPVSLRADCQAAFLAEVKKQLPKQAKLFVADLIARSDAKINAEINEENLIAEYSAKLLAVNVTHNCTTSVCLIASYNDYLESIQPEPVPVEPAPIGTATGS
jgi:hypothetical protein